MSTKHLHICHALSFGGITTFVRSLVKLNSEDNVNHHILVWQKASNEAFVTDISKSTNQNKEFDRILSDYDLIFVHALKPSFIPKLFKLRRRVYLFQHGMTFGTGLRKIYKIIKYFFVVNILRFNIICSSEFAKSKLKAQIPIFNDSLIKIIPFGIDLEHQDQISESKPELSIGFAGRLVPQKRIEKILDSLSQLNCEGAVTFYLAGTGQLLEPLKRKAAELTNNNVDVVFLGELDDMSDFYSKIDVFVLPSIGESYGLVVLEALFYNIPVIVFEDTGACVDFVIPEKNGFVVKNNNELSDRLCQLQSEAFRMQLKRNIQHMDLSQYHISNTKILLDEL